PLMLLLLDRYQIDVDAVSIYRQRTALHSASEYGQLSTAKLLLQRGASPDAQDFEGTTPLHLATGKRSKALIILLIENGANTELENHARHTPLHYATKLNDPAILQLL
ncbi:ankyrin repeat-containing domain protein, partial [Kalaharituber pfeilii]